MKNYGIEMEGPFISQKVTGKGSFDPSEGRVLYDEDDETLWYGDSTGWTSLSMPAGTTILFCQDSAPPGWTKKVDWTDNSMLVYTTGNIASGGSDNPVNWATTILVANHATLIINAEASHTHSTGSHTLTLNEIPAHTHVITGGYHMGGGASQSYTLETPNNHPGATGSTGGGASHNHGNTGAGSSHNHGWGKNIDVHKITDSTFAPKYQSVIAATKD